MSHVLLIEDEQALRHALATALTAAGYDVSEAVNGKEGLEVLATKRIDLVLLDIVMPIMNGLDFLTSFNKSASSEIPVIVITNLAESEVADTVLQQGVYDYVVKADWKIQDIVELVTERLKRGG